MARKANWDRAAAVYQKVQQYPGHRAGFFARLLGLHRNEGVRSLTALEDRGYLLSEDRLGRLWPFGRKKL